MAVNSAKSTVKGDDPDRLITIKEVCAILGCGRAFVYKKLAAGEFPAPVRLGTRFTRHKNLRIREYAADPAAWIAANARVAA